MASFPWRVFFTCILFLTVVLSGAAIVLRIEGPTEEGEALLDDSNVSTSSTSKHSDCDVEHRQRWTYGTAIYFCVVILTTIGYGDLAPVTPEGKAFIVVYCSIGLPVTFYFVSVLTEWLMGEAAILAALKAKKQDIEREGGVPSHGERTSPYNHTNLRARIRYCWNTNIGAVLALAGFWLLVLAGGLVFSLTEDWSYGDAFYFSFVSATTIGLGDLFVRSAGGKVSICFFAVMGLCLYSYVVSTIARNFAQRINKKLMKENLIEMSVDVVDVNAVLRSLRTFSDNELKQVKTALARWD